VRSEGEGSRRASANVFHGVAGDELTFCLIRMDVGAWSTGSLPFTAQEKQIGQPALS
jgi:hypothetical protein